MARRKWKLKSGTANLIVDGVRKRMKPGETVTCEDYEMPEAFKNSFELVLPPGSPPPEKREPDDSVPVDSFI